MKCLAPLILAASTVAPHAQECPVFPAHENYICDTYGTDQRPTNEAKFGLVLKASEGANVRSYQVTTYRRPAGEERIVRKDSNLVVGGDPGAGNASCGKFDGISGGRVTTLLARGPGADGQPTETYFYPQGGGIVRMTFKVGGNLIDKNICRPHFEKKLAPAPRPK